LKKKAVFLPHGPYWAQVVPTDHDLNGNGRFANYAPNDISDVLIAIGNAVDDRVTGNLEKYKQAKVIHFEIDPAEVHRMFTQNIAVLG
jgi:acetolactate synthase-1/2/3 large subunit